MLTLKSLFLIEIGSYSLFAYLLSGINVEISWTMQGRNSFKRNRHFSYLTILFFMVSHIKTTDIINKIIWSFIIKYWEDDKVI